jgi:hypothetical protein
MTRINLATLLALGALGAPSLAAAGPCPAGTNIIIGTNGDDVLTGTPGDDCIRGNRRRRRPSPRQAGEEVTQPTAKRPDPSRCELQPRPASPTPSGGMSFPTMRLTTFAERQMSCRQRPTAIGRREATARSHTSGPKAASVVPAAGRRASTVGLGDVPPPGRRGDPPPGDATDRTEAWSGRSVICTRSRDAETRSPAANVPAASPAEDASQTRLGKQPGSAKSAQGESQPTTSVTRQPPLMRPGASRPHRRATRQPRAPDSNCAPPRTLDANRSLRSGDNRLASSTTTYFMADRADEHLPPRRRLSDHPPTPR